MSHPNILILNLQFVEKNYYSIFEIPEWEEDEEGFKMPIFEEVQPGFH